MVFDAERLPAWVTWQRRPFPDANLLLLRGRQPVLVDSGFVGHAEDTAARIRAHTGHVALVVNTHWHSDHVGGNGLLQAMGAGIAASGPDAQAVARRDPGCCQAEYLDQPVSPYTVDEPLDHGQVLIRDGMSADEVEPYLHARAWLADAARLLGRTPEVLAAELVETMLRSGAVVLRGGRLHAAAEHTPVAAGSLRVPFPRAWPVAAPTRAGATEPQ